ncbi:MAG: hypothetical protein MUF62_01850 [Chitinophagaceae bacterium]|nr:hypothetical protein [Chitinophagaceae bacterium]
MTTFRFTGSLLALLLAMAAVASSDKQVPGYIIKPNGDTLWGMIDFGGFKRATNSEYVTLIDSTGVAVKYKAKEGEVLGYGMKPVLDIRIDYLYFSVKPAVESGFFQRYSRGAKYTLYYRMVSANMGTVEATSPYYVLVNAKGEYAYFGTCTICGWKKKMREIMKDDDEAVLAELEELRAKDIATFVLRHSD